MVRRNAVLYIEMSGSRGTDQGASWTQPDWASIESSGSLQEYAQRFTAAISSTHLRNRFRTFADRALRQSRTQGEAMTGEPLGFSVTRISREIMKTKNRANQLGKCFLDTRLWNLLKV